MQVGKLLGPQLLFKYFDAFGFADKTGIDLPGESRSIYVPVERMTAVDLACISFGQTNSITPIQMITAACAVANGGYLVQPHIVSKILDSNGNIVKTASTSPKRQVISQDTSKRICTILQQDATTGTAKSGYIAGYRVCGKTGTSEKQGEAKGEYIASYCGFAPEEDPQVAMLVFYDEPHGPNGYYGSPVAGPTFLATMTQILPYLGVEPQYNKEELEKLDGKAPDVSGKTVAEAKNEIAKADLSVKVYGDGKNVISQVPEPGKAIPKKGTVVLINRRHFADGNRAETCRTCRFQRPTRRRRMRESTSALRAQRSQAPARSHRFRSIPAGTKVTPGTVVTVTFSEKNSVF